MSEYWLISAPGDKTCQQTWETLNNVTSKQNNLCVNYKFHIPDLKVGTLDQLVGLSDDLGKLDTYVEQITRKVASYLGEVLEDQRDKLHENLLANNSLEPASAPRDNPNSQLINHKEKYTVNNNNISANNCNKKIKFSKNRNNTQSNMMITTTATTTTSSSLTCPSCRRRSSFNISTESEERHSNDDTTLCNCDKNSVYSKSRNNDEILNNSDETSDDIIMLDWWFTRHKRGSNKSRSRSSSQINMQSGASQRTSPVSSCCGSSQERSSADIEFEDLGEPPPMPLSPADLPSYITRFQWDMAKYPIKQSLRNIADIISKQVGQIDADLKTKSTAYNNLKGNLQNLEKKQTGSLMTRNLADLVKKEHFILDSEYLTTLLVIVPKPLANDWTSNHEKITSMIVPRSSTLISQDAEYCLFNVHLFKKVVEEFKLHARERKFVVRDFVYNEEELAAGKNEITKLVTDKKKQFGPLVRWLKVNFSECFCAWIHVKALRVFVESVLRYGLPVNFQAILIQPNKKSIKRLRDQLNQLYGHLDGSSSTGGSGGSHNTDMDIPGLGFGASEYYPYVYYKLGIDMVDDKKV